MKPKTISGDVTIDSGPDDDGSGHYVGIRIHYTNKTWLYPAEARQLARALLKAAEKPKPTPKRRKRKGGKR